MDTQLPGSAPPYAAPLSARPANGLGVAALVLGVASLVAAVSFVLFPLALPGGLFAAVLGVPAVAYLIDDTLGEVLERGQKVYDEARKQGTGLLEVLAEKGAALADEPFLGSPRAGRRHGLSRRQRGPRVPG